MITLNPYLSFTNQSEAALNFYKNIFGGELEVARFSEMADKLPYELAEEHKDLLMHGVLKAGTLQLMAADSAPMGPADTGSSISLSLSGDDETTLTNYFKGLSEGGSITVPLDKASWGDMFGMLTDKFGVGWMVNITSSKG